MMLRLLLTLMFLGAISGCADTQQKKNQRSNFPPPNMVLMEVGSQKVDCVGVAPMKCLVVNGNNFYSPIEGFDFEPGYTYSLEVKKEHAYPEGQVPADANAYKYTLIKMVEKTPVL